MNKIQETMLTVFISLLMMFGILLFLTTQIEESVDNRMNQSSSVVKVITPGGHGSGVNIGDGYYLTNHHVVGVEKQVTLKNESQEETQAQVLWSNEEYDVALIYQPIFENTGSSPLDCVIPAVGERVIMAGNPTAFEFLEMEGRVAGKPIQMFDGGDLFVPVDGTVVPGMSGGPVFDNNGHVVGINSMTAVAPLGMAASFVDFAFFIPGKSICQLMGKVQ